jgi:hypothetical protein
MGQKHTLDFRSSGESSTCCCNISAAPAVRCLRIEPSSVVQRQRTAWNNHYSNFRRSLKELFSLLACSDIYFVGGFGTVAWVDVKEYSAAKPDVIAASNVSETLQVCETLSESRNIFPLFDGVHRKKPLGMAPELLEARGCT